MLVNTTGNGQLDSRRGARPRSLWRDRRGAVAVYVAISAPVLLGIGALSIDLGRVMTVNTELQSAVDGAALAGARELDRFAGARDRARAAAAGAVANLQTFATGGADVTIDTGDCADPPVAPCIRFLKDLPPSDADPITAVNLAATDEEARFIEVHVAARTVTNVLIRLVGGPATSSTSATAVAGNDQVYCNVPPIFICNPVEPPGNTDLQLPVDTAALEGRQVRLFGQGGAIIPAKYGLICPLGTEGETRCGEKSFAGNLASVQATCYGREPTGKGGAPQSDVRLAINARHDYWLKTAKDSDTGIPWRQQERYQPAANVTMGGEPKGSTGGTGAGCEYQSLPATQAMGLPRDQCQIDGNCDVVPGNINGNIYIGDGNWDYQEYFRINQGCDQSANPTCKPADWDGVTGGAGWPPTRYEVYRYELERAPDAVVSPGQTIYDSGGSPVETTAEDGRAQCYQGTPPPIPGYSYYPASNYDEALLGDRRILPLTVANCGALVANGVSTSGYFQFDPADVVYVFLTEPIMGPGASEIFVEILGPLDADALDSLTRDVVQLYRR